MMSTEPIVSRSKYWSTTIFVFWELVPLRGAQTKWPGHVGIQAPCTCACSGAVIKPIVDSCSVYQIRSYGVNLIRERLVAYLRGRVRNYLIQGNHFILLPQTTVQLAMSQGKMYPRHICLFAIGLNSKNHSASMSYAKRFLKIRN